MPLLREHVHVMTIHQAKGLEFPVVAVGRLDKASAPDDTHEKELFAFYEQLTPEPANRIPAFDFQRLYYVAFSRACQLLILTANKKPHKQFAPIWHRATAWEYASGQLRSTSFLINEGKHLAFKPRYSFTTHIQLYTTCPRQFEYFQQHGFTPTQPAEAFTGQLVHQTLERIHRLAYDGHLSQINEHSIQQIIEQNFLALQAKYPSTTRSETREKAARYVFNYIQNNYADIQQNIEDTEMDFRLEREEYTLTGKIDLIIRRANGLEIIDFKTRMKPENYEPSIKFYKQQLYLYAEALEERKQQPPSRLLLYWLTEECKENAVMEIPYNHDDIFQIRNHFDDVVNRINQQKFHVTHPPDEAICKTCTLRFLCVKQKIISFST